MSGLIDPSTGRPFGPTTQQIAHVVTQHQQKLQALTHQVIHLGIFLEYCCQQIEASGVNLDLEGFQEFAKEKYTALEEESKAQIAAETAAAAAAQAGGDVVVDLDTDRSAETVPENTPTEIILDE